MPVPLHWHTEPFLLIALIGIAWVYALLLWPLRPRFAHQKRPSCARTLCFYLALMGTYLTVASPLDQIGEDFLFSLHMVQHMLLIYVLPPMFLWGTPLWLIDAVLAKASVKRVVALLTHPVIAGLSFTLCYTLWHIPVLYEAALQNKLIHIFEHCTMFVTALQMWWPVMGPSKVLPPIRPPLRMLYVFILMIVQFPVFGVLTFSGEVLYTTYEFAPRIFEITPLQDQILGGVVMKLFNMVASLTVFGISFYSWYYHDNLPQSLPRRQLLV